MTLATGARIGPYEVVGQVGRGGMGEVYRARDTRLGRAVAIKVLPPEDAADPDRRRLSVEAKAIAALDHPHICALYDVGSIDGVDYLVMQYLEGPTLAARIAQGPLPAVEAARIASDLASALAAAHGAGLVHRDVKPGNVMLTASGPKLLDFGLARDTAPPGADQATGTITTPGMVVGTAPYMAPEQVRGDAVDGRCDIFALGAVTYEMLTGRRAFDGASGAEIAGAVMLKEPPPLAEVKPDVPPALAEVVQRCLAKPASGRFQSASDLAFALKTIAAHSGSGTAAAAAAAATPVQTRRWPMVAGLGALVLLLVAAAWSRSLPAAAVDPPGPKRLSLNPPDGMRFVHGQMPMLSPDGTKVAANLRGPDGRLSAWVMDLSTGDARALPDAASGARWFWKPDSTMLGFFSEGNLRVVPAGGGSALSVATIGGMQGFGASWNRRDQILFAPSDTGLWAASADGGPPRQLTTPGPVSAIGEWWPTFLADDEHFVSFLEADDQRSGIYLGSLAAPAASWLLPAAGRAVSSGDYLLFPRDGTLVAQRLAPDGLAPGSSAQSLGLGVAVNPNGLNTLVSVSLRGELLVGSEELMQARLVWLDRTGRELGEVGPPRAFRNAVLSPDGASILEDRRDARTGRHQVWRFDVARQSSMLLYEAAYSPQWSADGTRLAFSSSRTRPTGISIAAATGAGRPERIYSHPTGLTALSDWSRDGRYLAFASRNETGNDNLTMLDLETGTATAVADSSANEFSGAFSPDTRWLAYWSDESGQRQIYIRSLVTGERHQVSAAGGANPRWRGDGHELFFLAPDGTMMAVATTLAPTVTLSAPRALFATGADAISRLGVNNAFDVTADGQRFLVRVPVSLSGRSPVTLILNWRSILAATASR